MHRELNFFGILLMIFVVMALGTNVGCYYDVEEELYPDLSCDTTNVTYSGVVEPLIRNACYACHDAANNFGGITIEGYAALKPFVDNGTLLGAIKREPGFSPMPKNQGPLPECDIEKIEVWILAGALDN